ncbi:MAG TPA: ATP-binding cassette domain-containing protein [Polyangia bacterium]
MSASTSATAANPATAAARVPGSALLTVKALSVGYDGHAILPPLSVTLRAGELWAVIGPNGAGKSTFLRTVLGLETPVGGEIEQAPSLRMSYVPQHGDLDPIFPISVLDFVLMGRQRSGNVIGRWRKADRQAAAAALDATAAGPLSRQYLRDLSGGQRQRVLIARAIASEADLFFLDEPTAALDIRSEQQVLELITLLRRPRNAAVVMVTHLVEDGLERADRALLLDRDHAVALAAEPETLRAAPAFQHIYGHARSRAEIGAGAP